MFRTAARQFGDKQARRTLPSGFRQLRIGGDVCARAWFFSVTKAGQTDSNAKTPEWLPLGLRLCLHLGKWVVCSGSLMAFGQSSWMNVEQRLLRNDPRTPTVSRLFSRSVFKGLMSPSESDPACKTWACSDSGKGGKGGFFLT